MVSLIAAGMLLSCAVDADTNTAAEGGDSSRAVQSWSLWAPLNNHDSGVFNKANWTNGGMFNCGWLPNNAYFNNGQLVLKLDNT